MKQTKGLSLEEIDELFGDPVAVHLTDANKDQMEELERQVREFSMPNGSGSVEMPDSESKGMEEENEHVERTSFQGKK